MGPIMGGGSYGIQGRVHTHPPLAIKRSLGCSENILQALPDQLLCPIPTILNKSSWQWIDARDSAIWGLCCVGVFAGLCAALGVQSQLAFLAAWPAPYFSERRDGSLAEPPSLVSKMENALGHHTKRSTTSGCHFSLEWSNVLIFFWGRTIKV